MPAAPQQPPFSTDELSTALNEVASWGLSSFDLLPPQFCPPNEARAKLVLLEEGDSAVVGVSEKGWKICLRSVADYSVRFCAKARTRRAREKSGADE